ncbi:hypothetical protein H6503_05980 [Candidatus Woesearchaeota archaeon]|nr:hypothetical protein [Candidatus Woesearchaeota archaeon]
MGRSRRERKKLQRKAISSNVNSGPSRAVSSVTVMHPDMSILVEAHNDKSIKFRFSGLDYIDSKLIGKLLEEYRSSMGITDNPDQRKQNEIRLFGQPGNYMLQLTALKDSWDESLKHSTEIVNLIRKGIPSIDNGIFNLLANLNSDNLISINGGQLFPIDVIKYQDNDQTIYYKRDGYFMGSASHFIEVMQREFKTAKDTKGKIQVFEKGLPSQLINDLISESEDFERRSSAFYDEGLEYERTMSIIDAVEYFQRAFYDLERSMIIQKYIIKHESKGDTRYGFWIDARARILNMLANQVQTVCSLTEHTGEYEYAKRFIDRKIIYANKLLDDIIAIERTNSFGNDPDNDYSYYGHKTNSELARLDIENIAEAKKDLERTEHFVLCQDGAYSPSTFNPLELSLDERLEYYMASRNMQMVERVKRIIDKRTMVDPLYLLIPPVLGPIE